jgi:hypothetical protein
MFISALEGGLWSQSFGGKIMGEGGWHDMKEKMEP